MSRGLIALRGGINETMVSWSRRYKAGGVLAVNCAAYLKIEILEQASTRSLSTYLDLGLLVSFDGYSLSSELVPRHPHLNTEPNAQQTNSSQNLLIQVDPRRQQHNYLPFYMLPGRSSCVESAVAGDA